MIARSLFVAAFVIAAVAQANEAFFAQEAVDAIAVKQAPTGPKDAAWAQVKGRTFSLAPQRTLRLHDKQANAVLQAPGVIDLAVKAVAAGNTVALLLEWPDETPELVREDEVNTYADSVALQVPRSFGPGQRLPAISMGDEQQPVRVRFLRAVKDGALFSELEAAGFGSSTRQAPAALVRDALVYDTAAKRWRAQFSLPVDAKAALVPVSFALWDGSRLERAGNKRLSSWHFVKLAGRALDAEYVKALSWGYSPGDLGDVQRGKVLAEAVCAACHHLPGRTTAAEALAPSFFDIGAIATPAYLRESIVSPSAVVLWGPNPNQHYDKGQPQDRFRAFPNSDAMRWFTVGPDGKRVSKMPPFAGFSPEQIGDLVAFLKSLDGRGPPP